MKNKIEDLLKRVKKTARSKYRGSERLEQHHRFAQSAIALLCCLMVFIPLSLIMEVETGYSNNVLYMGQITISVFLLIYSILLSQERYEAWPARSVRDGVLVHEDARNDRVHVHRASQLSMGRQADRPFSRSNR